MKGDLNFMTYKKISKIISGLIPKEFMIIDLQSLASVDFVGLTNIKKSLEKRTEKIIYVTNQKHHKGKGSLKFYGPYGMNHTHSIA